MKLIQENLAPTLIILIAGLIISFAVVPLQDTEWAESIRMSAGGFDENFEEDGMSEGESFSRIAMVIFPLIKVTLLMGVGGLLTALVLSIIRIIKRLSTGVKT